ncbi:hypothetical protein EJ03DRAFT_263478 [Teratosphaeria nubilosa]|uniref:Uncharacterized protein n=1 Tax=Teratosphaeria nubilosa TaxID=161662 RepID=A0A6G1LN39_9PEZI|nr:hypothetical protein EJ03DRAFT_263478 [Teratosphaeria nubilosa]
MSKAATSPTARLLQNSRLFSLPRPLPAPPLETISSTGIYRASDTATLPHPTHQAVATPPSSQFRGDWGLKRPLPARATRSSSATIRVRAQDTPEHITDFGSAADHSQTSRKWQEIGVPLLIRQAKRESKPPPPVSAFDDSIDNTDPAVTNSPVGEKSRWKYKGPWVAGMQSGEFDQWLRGFAAKRGRDGVKALVGRSKIDEWREHLRSYILEKRLAERKREAQDEGEQLGPNQLAELRDSLFPTEAELREYEKKLRDDHVSDNLSSELTALIVSFLDLPSVTPAASLSPEFLGKIQKPSLRSIVSSIQAEGSDIPPPSTHPSAGLSYIRTIAVMENHPLHGPQAHRAPFLARVVRPRIGSSGTEYQAQLGVGGVVANDPVSGSHYPRDSPRLAAGDPSMQTYDPEKMSYAIEPDLEGGNKMWVHPQQAFIDEKGRIQLSVIRGDREAVPVRTGNVDHIHEERAASLRTMGSATAGLGAAFGGNATRYKPGTQGNANYGYSLSGPEQPVRQTTVPKSGVQGFDDSVVGKIREVLERGDR